MTICQMKKDHMLKNFVRIFQLVFLVFIFFVYQLLNFAEVGKLSLIVHA